MGSVIDVPEHLPDDVSAVWRELVGGGATPGPDLEAYCGQVARLRDAQRRLNDEGLVIADPKGFPIPHPAIQIELRAQEQIKKWGSRFTRGR